MNISQWFVREKWLHVKTLSIPCVAQHRVSRDESEQTFYIQLFESNKGNRRYEFYSTVSGMSALSLKEFGLSLPVYQEKVVRWLSGRRDPEISTYAEIDIEDTANTLRGTIK